MPIKNVHLPHKFADMTLVARPDFKSVAQLRGKKIGVSSLSGSVYSSTRAMLSAGGLDPDRDVVIIPMGREPIRLQALFAGSIDATPRPVPLHAIAEEKGYSLLADIEGKFEVPFSGITVTDKKLRENADGEAIYSRDGQGRQFFSEPSQRIGGTLHGLVETLEIDR